MPLLMNLQKAHGLDYHISDRSGGLSVGQAQRLALARAMLQNGQFWLLDEPDCKP